MSTTRSRTTSRLLWLAAFSIFSTATATAQLRISEPIEPDARVRQTSSTSPLEQPLQRSGAAAKATHVRIAVRFLFLDSETRKSVYSQIPNESIRRLANSPAQPSTADLESTQSTLQCSQFLAVYPRCTTSVVNEAAVRKILELVDASANSEKTDAPALMMLDGETGDLNNAVQRPFVVDIQLEHGEPKPIVKILEDGIRIRMLAKPVQPDKVASPAIELTAEVIASNVLGIKSDQIFGLTDQPLEIQVPLYATKQVLVSEQLVGGQSILIDPHVTSPESVVTEADPSMLGKLPYVGRRFRGQSTEITIDRNVMVLLRPEVVRAAASESQPKQ